MNQKVLLLKDLPGCPAGRIFKENIKGDFFHSMTDQEVIDGTFKDYFFTKEEICANDDFFSLIKEEPAQAKTLIPDWIESHDISVRLIHALDRLYKGYSGLAIKAPVYIEEVTTQMLMQMRGTSKKSAEEFMERRKEDELPY